MEPAALKWFKKCETTITAFLTNHRVADSVILINYKYYEENRYILRFYNWKLLNLMK